MVNICGRYCSRSGRIWWRHQMETFSALLAICAGNSPVPGEFPAQKPVTRSFGVFFDLRLIKRLRKQSWGWWFETLPRPLWRHSNELHGPVYLSIFPLECGHMRARASQFTVILIAYPTVCKVWKRFLKSSASPAHRDGKPPVTFAKSPWCGGDQWTPS